MSGNWIYDYFMGSTLNPRIGSVDIKMFAEIRISWTLLFAIAMGAVSKQFELYGRVSGNAWLFALGTGLYLNACAKVTFILPFSSSSFKVDVGMILLIHAGVVIE